MGEDEIDDDWADYESGPFCRHYSTPGDCDAVCARCGHNCARHGDSHDNSEPCDGEAYSDVVCDCPGWPEDPIP